MKNLKLGNLAFGPSEATFSKVVQETMSAMLALGLRPEELGDAQGSGVYV